jgi:hypothetical protein
MLKTCTSVSPKNVLRKTKDVEELLHYPAATSLVVSLLEIGSFLKEFQAEIFALMDCWFVTDVSEELSAPFSRVKMFKKNYFHCISLDIQ